MTLAYDVRGCLFWTSIWRIWWILPIGNKSPPRLKRIKYGKEHQSVCACVFLLRVHFSLPDKIWCQYHLQASSHNTALYWWTALRKWASKSGRRIVNSPNHRCYILMSQYLQQLSGGHLKLSDTCWVICHMSLWTRSSTRVPQQTSKGASKWLKIIQIKGKVVVN